MAVPLVVPAARPTAARADGPAAAATRPAVVALTPAETRAAFLKLIGRPVVDLAVRAEPAVADTADGALVRVAFSYDAEAGVRVPGVLIKRADAPAGRRLPVVVVMHGTGGSKQGDLGRLRRFAHAGFLAAAIDARYHGERTTEKGTAEYCAAIAKAFAAADPASRATAGATGPDPAGAGAAGADPAVGRRAFPFYFDTVWDVRRLFDYLQTRDDVDIKRLGLFGISKGGIETYLTAAADERVAAAVPCIGVQSFAYGLETDGWKSRVGTVKAGFDAAAKGAGVAKPDAAFARRFYDALIPGIYDRFDGPAMLTITAPRPVLVINGEKDDKTPLAGVHLAADAGSAAYAAAGVPDRFRLIVQPNAGHTVTEPAMAEAVKWFERWLTP